MAKLDKKHTEVDELLTKPQLAKKLKVCTRKIELMVIAGEIPVIRIGSSVRFNWSQVLDAIDPARDL